jgi:hypothetical protein
MYMSLIRHLRGTYEGVELIGRLAGWLCPQAPPPTIIALIDINSTIPIWDVFKLPGKRRLAYSGRLSVCRKSLDSFDPPISQFGLVLR